MKQIVKDKRHWKRWLCIGVLVVVLCLAGATMLIAHAHQADAAEAEQYPLTANISNSDETYVLQLINTTDTALSASLCMLYSPDGTQPSTSAMRFSGVSVAIEVGAGSATMYTLTGYDCRKITPVLGTYYIACFAEDGQQLSEVLQYERVQDSYYTARMWMDETRGYPQLYVQAIGADMSAFVVAYRTDFGAPMPDITTIMGDGPGHIGGTEVISFPANAACSSSQFSALIDGPGVYYFLAFSSGKFPAPVVRWEKRPPLSTVIWRYKTMVDGELTLVEYSREYEVGSIPSFTPPEITQGAFCAWEPAVTAVVELTGSMTSPVYTAQYDYYEYTVTWEYYDKTGTLTSTTDVCTHGTTPTPPKVPFVETKTFRGWPPLTEVTGDVTYTAQYYEQYARATVTYIDDRNTQRTETIEYPLPRKVYTLQQLLDNGVQGPKDVIAAAKQPMYWDYGPIRYEVFEADREYIEYTVTATYQPYTVPIKINGQDCPYGLDIDYRTIRDYYTNVIYSREIYPQAPQANLDRNIATGLEYAAQQGYAADQYGYWLDYTLLLRYTKIDRLSKLINNWGMGDGDPIVRSYTIVGVPAYADLPHGGYTQLSLTGLALEFEVGDDVTIEICNTVTGKTFRTSFFGGDWGRLAGVEGYSHTIDFKAVDFFGSGGDNSALTFFEMYNFRVSNAEVTYHSQSILQITIPGLIDGVYPTIEIGYLKKIEDAGNTIANGFGMAGGWFGGLWGKVTGAYNKVYELIVGNPDDPNSGLLGTVKRLLTGGSGMTLLWTIVILAAALLVLWIVLRNRRGGQP